MTEQQTAPCPLHSGLAAEQKGLGRSVDQLRDACEANMKTITEAHRQDLGEIKAGQAKTNEWLQTITTKALQRWSPGQVKAFIAIISVTVALATLLVTVLVAYK